MRWSLEAQTWTCFHLSPVGPYFIHIHSDKYGLSWGKSQLIGPLFFILWFCLFFWKTNNLFSCPSGSRAGPTLKTTVYGKKDNSFFQTTVLLKKIISSVEKIKLACYFLHTLKTNQRQLMRLVVFL